MVTPSGNWCEGVTYTRRARSGSRGHVQALLVDRHADHGRPCWEAVDDVRVARAPPPRPGRPGASTRPIRSRACWMPLVITRLSAWTVTARKTARCREMAARSDGSPAGSPETADMVRDRNWSDNNPRQVSNGKCSSEGTPLRKSNANLDAGHVDRQAAGLPTAAVPAAFPAGSATAAPGHLRHRRRTPPHRSRSAAVRRPSTGRRHSPPCSGRPPAVPPVPGSRAAGSRQPRRRPGWLRSPGRRSDRPDGAGRPG